MPILPIICSCLFFVLTDDSSPDFAHARETRYEFEFGAMGSNFRVVGYAQSSQQFDSAKKRIEERIRQLEDTLSDFRQDSEINRLANQAPHDHPAKISTDLWRICTASSKLHQQTDGAFDPTIGPVSKIWRLARKRNRLPDRQEIVSVMKSVGWSKVVLDPEKELIQLTANGMQLDFGGIAKGFAADEAIGILKQHEIHSALVDAGGDIHAANPPPGREGWTIVIENGLRTNSPDEANVRLSIANVGIATSGDSIQRMVKNGHSHSHVLDPRTGLAVEDSCGVTVIAADATTADAWATALCVLGPERGMDILKNDSSVHALFECRDPDKKQLQKTQTSGIEKFVTGDSVTNPAAGVRD